MSKKEIVNSLEKHRKKNGLSVENLANLLTNVSVQTIKSIEEGRYSNPSIYLVLELSAVLNVDPDELFYFKRTCPAVTRQVPM